MSQIFSVIPEKTISLITENYPKDIYNIIKQTYINYKEGQSVNPPSYFLTFPDKPSSRIIALPAALTQNPKIAGIKWISSNPDNIKKNLKRASAVIILNDYETGYPIACLEGSLISALRTVYSAILVTNILTQNQKIKTLGIVGSGNISYTFLKILNLLKWDIEQVLIYDKNIKQTKNFIDKLHTFHKGQVRHISTLEKLIATSNVILFATTALEPYITNLTWFQHNPIVLNVSLRDLSPEILIKSNNIVDDVKHVLKANTSPHLTYIKYQHHKFINGTIAELLQNNIKITDDPIIVSPMGMGILDIALAYYIYKLARKKDSVIQIENFFG